MFTQQVGMRKLAAEYGTHIMAWSPLARGMNGLFTNEVLAAVGKRHGVDTAQVALKFLVDEGIIIIPQSTKRERMERNLFLDTFTLTEEDREAIRRLDMGYPISADLNDPQLLRYLLNYDKQFNPNNRE